MKSPYFSDYFWEKISWLTKSSRFHGCLKLGLLCPITELLWELGTNVVVTSPKEDICRELMSKWPRSEKGEIILSKRDTKTTKIQRNMSLSDSSSERSFNSEDSEANLAEVEDEQSDRESQVSCQCESLENDIAYANEPLADEEWLMEKIIIIINHVKHN